MMRSAACTKILIVSFAVWFVILFFVARHLSSLRSTGGSAQETKYEIVNNRLENALNKLKALEQHNGDLKILVNDLTNSNIVKDDQALDKLLIKAENLRDTFDRTKAEEMQNSLLNSPPSTQYEIIRKQINNDVREFWYYISAQIATIREKSRKNSPEIADQLSNFLNVATQHKFTAFMPVIETPELQEIKYMRRASYPSKNVPVEVPAQVEPDDLVHTLRSPYHQRDLIFIRGIPLSRHSIHGMERNKYEGLATRTRKHSAFRSLVKDLNTLDEVDGYSAWRQSEAASLAEELKQRLKYLQNPKDCDTAKKIVCNLNKGCGFGCQIHHAAYCLIVAYATKRTLILTSKGWRYHKNGWEDIFLPISETCLSPAGSSRVGWPGKPEAQVIVLPIIDTLTPKPEYLPPAIPKDLAPRLIRLHSQPIVWWIGHMLKYLMRPQPATSEFLNYSKQRLKFKKPIVGVHIRRTDKIGTEAAFHSIDEYMKKVEDWYEEQENNGIEIKVRRIFLATDDPKVIAEAREKYPHYEVLGDPEIAKTAAMSTRYSDNSLYGILLDVYLLSLSDHIVCTFSSQVCRAAYELMQTYIPDATSHFTSLDDVYYYGGQNGHASTVVIAHQAESASELDLKVGDLIAVAGNHWDGYSKGRNLRTNQVGLYPSFKVQNRVKIADFPTYEEVPKKN